MELFRLIAGVVIFIITFYFIITEKYPKSIVSMIGAGLMVITKVLSEHEALSIIGHNLEILFLLMGMMMIVEIMSETGIFQWVAIKIAQLVRGNPVKILVFISIITALFSAVLDNVTTILLVVPVTIFLAKRLEVDPKPFVLLQIFSSNIGGTATMIGDPPNLIIASLSGLDFNDFIINLGPIIVINMAVLLGSAVWYFKDKLQVSNELKAGIMELSLERTIKDKKLLIQSLAVFLVVIIGFLTNAVSEFGLAIIAILGASLLLFLSKKKPDEIFSKIEWDTLFFFGGLFILVEGLENLGIIAKLSEFLLVLTNKNVHIASPLILIMSTILSPIIGSIPHALSFGKILVGIIGEFHGNTQSLWWALTLGACLGGNMTIVGAAANIVGAAVAKKGGIEITFMEFFKWGLIVVGESTILSLIYLYVRY
ncbi:MULTISPECIES: ArsB/NhaD family transporter [Fusobacterium]|uniref:ArsB/NhaD family transporter n=1 Tax=Fusobacterium hominis TaxID=2764326 RepID=A0A7G9GW07_9FUSO|nr:MULTISPECIES: ArsB/NhaD family transporter [Fusobacterium]QNM14989.1 ArsB/NhaD family transporter [Fusobacterium hominis]